MQRKKHLSYDFNHFLKALKDFPPGFNFQALMIKIHASVILQCLHETKVKKLLPLTILQLLHLKLSHEKISDIVYNVDALFNYSISAKS